MKRILLTLLAVSSIGAYVQPMTTATTPMGAPAGGFKCSATSEGHCSAWEKRENGRVVARKCKVVPGLSSCTVKIGDRRCTTSTPGSECTVVVN